MRSNDAYLGLPHDIFVFTMFQELVARCLGVDVGAYNHLVGHLHLYEEHVEKARLYLSEGLQTIEPMPPMPEKDPVPLLPRLREAEQAIRLDPTSLAGFHFDPYWEDLLRLLRIYSEKHHEHEGFQERIRTVRGEMNSSVYNVYFLS